MFRKENVDRRLLTFAIIAFTLELALFLGDVGLLPLHWFSRSNSHNERLAIGEVKIAQQNVRRRGFDSNIWEDSLTKDLLFENDSILTLSGSTAKLKLQGDINIELHENTLVVLEPVDTDLDKPFRLRFSRGDLRAQNSNRGVQLKNGDWAITASPGTDLSLRAVDGGQVEVEVNSGEVQVKHALHGLSRQINSNQRLTLFPEEAGEVVTTSSELKWGHPEAQKIYTHKFPIHATFTWQGEAQTIEVLSPSKGIKIWPLKAQQNSADLEFNPGSYHLTLHGVNKISRTLSVQVLKAPKVVHLTPLPRDRIKTQEPTWFAWLSELSEASYRLEFASDDQFHHIVHSVTSQEPKIKTAVPSTGALFWRVTTFDEENFMIPAAYFYPIFSHPDPLSAPTLRAPTAVDSQDGASTIRLKPRIYAWQWLWSLLIPATEGQTVRSFEAKKMPIPPVIFNWEALPGADHYIIEISSSLNFEAPEVIAKLSTNFYTWSNFNKQIYYYRVAGGTAAGRIGVFSQPEKIDLTIWPPPKKSEKNAETITLPKQLATQLPPAAKPTLSELVTIMPESVKPPPLPEKTAPVIETPSSADQTVARPTSNQPPIYGAIWWHSFYQAEKQNSPQAVQADLAGGSFLGLGFNLDMQMTTSRLLISGNWQNLTWQPRSKSKWPFQDKLTTTAWNLDVGFTESDSNFYYGGAIQQVSRLQRVDFEKVIAKSHTGFGPMVGWRHHEGSVCQSHEFQLVFSNGFTQINSNNFLQYEIHAGLFLGLDLNLSAGFGGYSFSSGQAGVQAGYNW